MSPGRLLSWVCLVPSPVVGPVPGAGRAKILRHICVRPGFGKRVGRWRVSGSRLRGVPPSFSTGVSRVDSGFWRFWSLSQRQLSGSVPLASLKSVFDIAVSF